jgi:tetratricopeptide (TPR) repeat protein
MALDERLESLLLQAEELRLQGQPVSPEQLCGHCPELVPELRRLLGKLDQVDNLLHVPALAAATPLRLSGYRIRRELGRGGMGVVYDAEQQALGRRVALKILPALPGQDPERVARFQREVRAAARLQHPNIVPVYEVGQEEGVWFYAMQFIPGRPVSDLISALRRRRDRQASPAAQAVPRASTAPGEAESSAAEAAPATRAAQTEAPETNLGVTASPGAGTTTSVVNGLGQLSPDTHPRRYFREVARLGQQVAEALACAHARGVLHRDVKPANLLVDETARVWVTDFGLAKVEEDEALTQSGAMLGTLRYMAPEQMRGAPEARSDIYSLGLTLYELLVLQPAFDAAEYLHLLELVAHHDPRRPRSLDARIPCDLETIVLKAIEKDPNRRYRTAQELADDLHRFLVGEPIRARPTPPWERAVKWARRRPTTAVLVGFALLAVATLLTLGLHYQARARQLAAEVSKELEQAAALRQQARAESGKPALALAAKARLHGQRARTLVETGPANADLSARVESLLASLNADEQDRQLQADLDDAMLAQVEGDVRMRAFARERALPLFRRALATYGLPVGKGDPPAAARRLGACSAEVRETVLLALEEWISLAERPKSSVEKADLDWLRGLWAALDPMELGKDIWTSERNPARKRAALEKLAETVDVNRVPWYALRQLTTRMSRVGAHERALALLRRAGVRRAGDFWINTDLGLALLELRPPDHAGAVRYLTAAVAVRPDSPGARLNLGNALAKQGALADAEAELRQALALNRKYALGHANLGLVLHLQSRPDEAIVELRRALALDPTAPDIRANLGEVLRSQGKLDEALRECRAAVRLNPNDGSGYITLALTLCDQGKPDEALRLIPRALRLDGDFAAIVHGGRGYALFKKGKLAEALAETRKSLVLDPYEAQTHCNLGTMLAGLGKLDEAAAACREAIRLAPHLAHAHANLGRFLRDQGKLDQALAAFTEVIKLAPNQPEGYHERGVTLERQGKDDEALADYERARRLHPNSAAFYSDLGAMLSKVKQTDEGLAAFHRALALDPKLARAHYNLGVTLRELGKDEQALAAFRKALELDPKHAPTQANIGIVLGRQGKRAEGIAALRRALELDPKLAAARYELGNLLREHGETAEALAEYRKVLEFEPKHGESHTNLGILLIERGQLNEGEAELRKAIEHDPKLFQPHNSLGNLLVGQGKLGEAVAEFRKAIALAPTIPELHANLGGALAALGKPDEAAATYRQALAINDGFAPAHAGLGELLRKAGKEAEALAAFRRALELDPNLPEASNNLAAVLMARGQVDEAIAALRKAAAGRPKDAAIHSNLGVALLARSKLDEALAAFRQAIALDPNVPDAHHGIAQILLSQGQFGEARASALRHLDLLPQGHPGRLGAAQFVKACERILELEKMLPAVLAGEVTPASTAERLEYARIAQRKQLHAEAVRLFADAFAADPGQAGNLVTQDRYNAACSAVLTAQAAKSTAQEAARWRKQALDWLRADLTAYGKLLKKSTAETRALVRQSLSHWRQDSDLSGIRAAAAVDSLPEEERASCRALWTDVEKLLHEVSGPLR